MKKIRSVHPSDDTPTDTNTDFENFECLRKRRSGGICFFSLADINCAVNSNSWVGLYKISYLRNVSIYLKETSQKSLKHLRLCVCQILLNLVQVCSFYCNMLSDLTFIWTQCIYVRAYVYMYNIYKYIYIYMYI